MTQTQKVALGIYLALLVLCLMTLLSSEFLGPKVRASVLPIAGEGFKMVLAALVGALSFLMGGGNAGRHSE